MRFVSAAILVLAFSTSAHAMLQLGYRSPIEIAGNLTFEEKGQEIVIEAIWSRQSLNIINDFGYALRIDSITAETTCLDGSEFLIAKIHSPTDFTNVVLPVGGPSFFTGDMYIHGMAKCANSGHIVTLWVQGTYLDSTGHEIYIDRSPITYITQ